MLLGLLGCAPQAIDGVTIRMDFADTADFWATPFPGEDRRDPDGSVSLAGFPNPDANGFTSTILSLIEGEPGFARSAAIRFVLSEPISLDGDLTSNVYLVDVDERSPEIGRKFPIEVRFNADGGPFGAKNELTLLPVQGVPLDADRLYAAVVRRDLAGLGVSLPMAQLAAGVRPEGMTDDAYESYAAAILALDEPDLAGLAVFRTGSPGAGLAAMLDDARSKPDPVFHAAPTLSDQFDGYCVYHTTLDVPSYQAGEPPFTSTGGAIPFVDGVPTVQRQELADVWITVPRGPMPATGWPTVVFVPSGGGGERPLVDRGVRDGDGVVLVPGSGLATDFAAVGWAGVSVDTPHLGERNVSGGDGQFLMFNITNPPAMLDNFRQADFETARNGDLVPQWVFPATDCDGFSSADGQARFDGDHLALFGHSMGGTIAPVAAAVQPKFQTLLWSGAGGSWIENVMFKQKPLVTRPLAEALLGYGVSGRSLAVDDPVLSLVQWAGEATDPPLHAGELGDRDILMTQGIVDHYILPPIANSLSLAAGLDLAGGSIDADTPELDAMTPLATLLPLSGGAEIELPASGNRDGHTRVVVQQREDGVEDGHEVVFQLESSKARIREFLRTSLLGTPTVPGP